MVRSTCQRKPLISRRLALLGLSLALWGCAPQASIAAPTEANPSATPSAVRSAVPLPRPLYQVDLAALTLPEGVRLTADQKGRPNQALDFGDSDHAVELPWDINPQRHPQLTITVWARFAGDPEVEPIEQVLSHDDGDFDRSLGLDARGGQWGWSTFAGNAEVLGGLPVQRGEWVFLAVTFDQSRKVTRLFAGDAPPRQAEATHGPGHAKVWIGGNPSHGEHFTGDIAHVQVFDRVLSEAEIQAVREQ